MAIPPFTVKPGLTAYEQLRLLDAWEAWGISPRKQLEWALEFFGEESFEDVIEVLSTEAQPPKSQKPIMYP
jgi:hypothetical protein